MKSVLSLKVPRDRVVDLLAARGRVDREGVADVEPVVLGPSFSSIDGVGRARARSAGRREPSLQSRVSTCARGRAGRPASGSPARRSPDLVLRVAERRGDLDAVDLAATSAPTPRGMSEKPSLLARIRSPAMRLVDRVVDRALDARRRRRRRTRPAPARSSAPRRSRPCGRGCGRRSRARAARAPRAAARAGGRPPRPAAATSRGLSSATPMKTAAAPTPTQASPGDRGRRRGRAPSAASAERRRARRRWRRAPAALARWSRAPRPRAAPLTGGTRVARERRDQRGEHREHGADDERRRSWCAARPRCRSSAGRSRAT